MRDLKAAKAENAQIQAAVDALLALKTEYKTATGKDFVVPATSAPEKKEKAKAVEPAKESKTDAFPKESAKEDTVVSKKALKKEEKKAKRDEQKGLDESLLATKQVVYLSSNLVDTQKVSLVLAHLKASDVAVLPYNVATDYSS
ncbi:hypothetical protein EON64_21220, partial [archaeon]